ncbi:hypothetical protein [Bailinhaonella thermotolerans]|uniref:Uncharacterized protein n=1 Tax=Bailinhaonella thermotolerans TaxID=1070861 RepID=A0A3A4ASC2_9ACTN|nr:hypothetical protein [Bailinhaonella thermotolerans]RJL24218.1 hypothetical protein D5H75_30735 [Bailinhaonella thermotolerans]
MGSLDDAGDELRLDHPAWTIWRSDAGRWWATLRRPLTAEEWEQRCSRTVDGDDPAKLAAALRAETDRQRRAAAVRLSRERAVRLGPGWASA